MTRILLALIAIMTACQTGDHEASQVVASTSGTVNQVNLTQPVAVGAEQLPLYVPKLKGKKCGIVVNQASLVGKEHLVDTLRALNVNIVKIFVPEHGFRGEDDAGATIEDGRDEKSGLPIVSLYGQNKKPSQSSVEDIEYMIFDLQDVGVRCYTYLSTLHYVMESCAQEDIPLLVLDRPNPNGHYVDGPIMEPDYTSFVGMHPVPLVYGMTIGEYALMIKGEGWIDSHQNLNMTVIPCHAYDHQTRYKLPVAPSPNLKSETAILMYPSLVFFEGTVVSVGRGTPNPFEVYGHPKLKTGSFTFTPTPSPGASQPKLNGQACFGQSFVKVDPFNLRKRHALNILPLLNAYSEFTHSESSPFFLENLFFDKLAGTDKLRKAILDGKSEEEIRDSWQKGLKEFESIRGKYLLYADAS